MKLSIPALSLVVLVGPSGAGKSNFAREHFLPTEVVSSDTYRGVVSDDETDQSATGDAFELVHLVARKRLARGRLTVIDATNVQPKARKPLIEIAREQHVLPVAIVFGISEKLCQERNRKRTDRQVPPHVIREQHRRMRQAAKDLRREGFRYVFTLNSPEDVAAVELVRTPLWTDKTADHGPFDIIGDIHGCFDELVTLLETLGYQVSPCGDSSTYDVSPPDNRRVIFLGDLTDRGPKNVDVLRLAMGMVGTGQAYIIPGNHDDKLKRVLQGRNVKITEGLKETLAQLDATPSEFRHEVASFIESMVSHYVLDDGKLVVAHAGMPERLQGRSSSIVRDTALFGVTTGETDEYGLPVRVDWAAEYRGNAYVIYGHTPVAEAEWINRTINIDTGCAFGGKLTALRYPELELVSVPSQETYSESPRPFLPEDDRLPVEPVEDRGLVLDIDDVLGRRSIQTRLNGRVTIREENAIAALEVMSRFAVDPRWIVYLPPTMSPSETTKRPGLLEHPDEAFAYFRSQGVTQVVCEEKHMGSRAVLVVCRDEQIAHDRFGISDQGAGICYTRTGRRFFADPALEKAFLERIHETFDAAGFWEEHETDWACLDGEIMPWSTKAQELLVDQYAALGAAAMLSLGETLPAIEQAHNRGLPIDDLLERYQAHQRAIEQYVDTYRHYCWPVESVDDLKVAPFHLLATEGRVHVDQDHTWHLTALEILSNQDKSLFMATAQRIVDVTDSESMRDAVAWWDELTGAGGEGFVVKPISFIANGRKGTVQPAIKCRGQEYLRIIYGPDYTAKDNLSRLRNRNLASKRSLALREFALGIEALERFVRNEPLYRIHECVFGVLALESEPVDARL